MAVTPHGPVGAILSFEPLTDWIPPDLHGSCLISSYAAV